MEPTKETRNLFATKTALLNYIIAAIPTIDAVLGLFGVDIGLKEWVAAHPDLILYSISALGFVVRYVTKGEVHLFGTNAINVILIFLIPALLFASGLFLNQTVSRSSDQHGANRNSGVEIGQRSDQFGAIPGTGENRFRDRAIQIDAQWQVIDSEFPLPPSRGTFTSAVEYNEERSGILGTRIIQVVLRREPPIRVDHDMRDRIWTGSAPASGQLAFVPALE